MPEIDQCAGRLTKANPLSVDASPPAQSSEQVCLLRTMRASGASSKAIAFTRWYYASSQDNESAFIDHLTKPRFGAVSIASMELPGRANNNFIYILVNGTPAVVNPDEAFAETGSPWANDGTFLAIKKGHSNAWVFPQEDFAGESALPGGGQRFTIAVPIVDGCHACARLGIVYIGYDFGPLGSAKGMFVTAVHHCPSSDARCKSL